MGPAACPGSFQEELLPLLLCAVRATGSAGSAPGQEHRSCWDSPRGTRHCQRCQGSLGLLFVLLLAPTKAAVKQPIIPSIHPTPLKRPPVSRARATASAASGCPRDSRSQPRPPGLLGSYGRSGRRRHRCQQQGATSPPEKTKSKDSLHQGSTLIRLYEQARATRNAIGMPRR